MAGAHFMELKSINLSLTTLGIDFSYFIHINNSLTQGKVIHSLSST